MSGRSLPFHAQGSRAAAASRRVRVVPRGRPHLSPLSCKEKSGSGDDLGSVSGRERRPEHGLSTWPRVGVARGKPGSRPPDPEVIVGAKRGQGTSESSPAGLGTQKLREPLSGTS